VRHPAEVATLLCEESPLIVSAAASRESCSRTDASLRLNRDLLVEPAVLASVQVRLQSSMKLIGFGSCSLQLALRWRVERHAEYGIRVRMQVPPESPLGIPMF